MGQNGTVRKLAECEAKNKEDYRNIEKTENLSYSASRERTDIELKNKENQRKKEKEENLRHV